MAGDHGIRHAQRAVVLLVVAAADAAGLNAQQRVYRPDCWQRKAAGAQIPHTMLHHRPRHIRHGAQYLTPQRPRLPSERSPQIA
jgi:hypothetical protein